LADLVPADAVTDPADVYLQSFDMTQYPLGVSVTQPSGPGTPGQASPQFQQSPQFRQFPQPTAPVPPATPVPSMLPLPPAGRFPPMGPSHPGGVAPPGAQFPPGGPMPPRPSAAKPLIIAAVVVVVLLLGGGLATALYLNRDESGSVAASGTSPSTGAAASSGASASAAAGAVVRRLPTCDTFPSATVTPLVPRGRLTGNTHMTTLSTMYDDAECSWDNVGLPDKQPPEVREIDLSLHAYNDDRDLPTESAKKGFARDRSDWESKAGSTSEHELDSPVTSLSGLGAGAFFQTYKMVADDAPASGIRLYLVVNNVETEINYWGLDGTYEEGTPIPADELSKGAQAMAHSVVDWLTSCTDCGS
jgi:hypothetical protein